MRKLWIVLVAVFATSLMMTAGVQAATTATKGKAHKIAAKQKAPSKTVKKAVAARKARGPAVRCKTVCYKTHRAKRAVPARAARGPVVTCPAPVVNVPQQAAPVVNVPAQPAPVVNVPPSPPNVGITVDDCSIFIVRENQLMVLDKNTYCIKKTVPLD